jgi:hypothetical protein
MRLLFVYSLALAACGSDPSRSDTDAGPVTRDAAPDPECMNVDRECPADAPFPGAPCEGALSCDYVDPKSMSPGTFTCTSGRWTGYFECLGCPPMLSERCRDPFVGSSPAAVTAGPSEGAFRPFTIDEHVPAILGGQGSGMVSFRLQVESPVAPSCVTLVTRTSYEGGMPIETRRAVHLRCGESLGILEIIPGEVCDFERMYDVDVQIEIVGVGTTEAHVFAQGADCPG